MKYHTKIIIGVLTLFIINFNLNTVFAANDLLGSYEKYIAESKEHNKKEKDKEVISITNDELYLLSKLVSSEAIYFWNPKISTCSWIKTLEPYKRIGNHVFAKE